jgi:uncharacterized protein with HEPN domain
MTERTIRDYLQDILVTIESCEHFIEGMDFDEFVSDEKTTFAVKMHLKLSEKLQNIFLMRLERNIRLFPGEKLQELVMC